MLIDIKNNSTYNNDDPNSYKDLDIKIDQTNRNHIIVTGTDASGTLRLELHFNADGKVHNETGPALYWFNCNSYHVIKNGHIEIVYWLRSHTANTDLETIIWYQNDVIHRIDGPADIDIVTTRGSGHKKQFDEYRVNGKLFSENSFLKQYMPDKYKEEQLQKVYKLLDKKYRIAHITSDRIIMELVP